MSAFVEAREWLVEHWDAQSRRPRCGNMRGWVERVFQAGWSVPTWPAEWWGRGLNKAESAEIRQLFRAAGAPGAGLDRTNIPASTIMAYGNDALRRELIPGFLTGKLEQCLLYSEPGAGSDLAAVCTRADRRDEHYVIDGHKIWTSGAHRADYGLLIARTDWSVPKRAGLSFFIIDMRQPGIDVRPIKQITGEQHFNEVFIDGAKVPAGYRLGAEGEGWAVMQKALAVERLLMGEGIGERRQGGQRSSRVSLIVAARSAGRLGDSVIRSEMATALARRHLHQLNLRRARSESAAHLMSLSKLEMSHILHGDARLLTRLLGGASLLDGPDHPQAADANWRAANAYMTSIGGGTDQIQRNIIAERLLGLPREADADANTPFGKGASNPGK